MEETPMNLESCGEVISRTWRSRAMIEALLLAGIVAAAVYAVGDLLSGVAYDASRPYSFRNQWISELTALGSPVRPLMVAVITVHDVLLIAFGLGIWRAAGRSRSLRWVGGGLVATTVLGLVIHPLFPMTSRWLESSSTDAMHGTLSLVWGLGISTVVVLGAVAYEGWFRLYSIGTVLVMMGFGMASGIAIQGIEQNDTPWAGAFERVNAYVLMAWFVVLAVMVIRRGLNSSSINGATYAPRTTSESEEKKPVTASP